MTLNGSKVLYTPFVHPRPPRCAASSRVSRVRAASPGSIIGRVARRITHADPDRLHCKHPSTGCLLIPALAGEEFLPGLPDAERV